ncbi:hypothetical protein ACIRYZ_19040 [Kitasatospora sp. NPDC101155]|uniref:hypothetical protein n=1 Tax=Kitasatospora sp. NPDC101155 TaxID=3364097 RepID=UPI003817C39C
MDRSAARCSAGDQRVAAQDLLDVEEGAGEELGDGGGDDIGGALDVLGDPVDLGAGEAAGEPVEAEASLAAVDGVDVEVEAIQSSSGWVEVRS